MIHKVPESCVQMSFLIIIKGVISRDWSLRPARWATGLQGWGLFETDMKKAPLTREETRPAADFDLGKDTEPSPRAHSPQAQSGLAEVLRSLILAGQTNRNTLAFSLVRVLVEFLENFGCFRPLDFAFLLWVSGAKNISKTQLELGNTKVLNLCKQWVMFFSIQNKIMCMFGLCILKLHWLFFEVIYSAEGQVSVPQFYFITLKMK